MNKSSWGVALNISTFLLGTMTLLAGLYCFNDGLLGGGLGIPDAKEIGIGVIFFAVGVILLAKVIGTLLRHRPAAKKASLLILLAVAIGFGSIEAWRYTSSRDQLVSLPPGTSVIVENIDTGAYWFVPKECVRAPHWYESSVVVLVGSERKEIPRKYLPRAW